jgi:hypothetical protein
MVVDPPSNIWPSNMMEIIKSITRSESPCPEPPLFQFDMSSKTAEKNFLILWRFNFNLRRRPNLQWAMGLNSGKGKSSSHY